MGSNRLGLGVVYLRQAGILLREVIRYRENLGLLSWPCVLAGGKSYITSYSVVFYGPLPNPSIKRKKPFPYIDFNFSPGEPGYALLAGDTLTQAQEDLLEKSRVVHVSVDPSVPLTNLATTDEDEDGGGTKPDPDRVITNARGASPADGLLSSSELVELFAVTPPPRSLYDEGQRVLESIIGSIPRCGERLKLLSHQRGAYEPEWTSYTHYWQTVLGEIRLLFDQILP